MESKKYIIDNPDLMAEWDWGKNNELGLDPNKLTYGSGKKAWWKCSEGHKWQAIICNRNKGNGCPYCSGRFAIKGENDLQTTNPNLAKEWNFEKNGDLKPDKLMENSNKKVWWKCSKGHEWQATISSRNNRNGCPYCSGRYAIIGENDLQTTNPNLAKEWNFEKNGDLKPNMVTSGSHKKVWWKCDKGHEWQAAISNRNTGTGCPYCADELQTSFPEQAIYFYIKRIFSDAINRDCHLGMELDIYIPSKRIAIEYDGAFWHKNQKRDDKKNKLCRENKIVLIRVKENMTHEFVEEEYLKIIPCTYSDKGLEKAIKTIMVLLNKSIDVNIAKDRTDIYTSFINIEKEQSLFALNSALVTEWNYEKNGDLKPHMVMANSGKKVWWKCSRGHEWQAAINNRSKGTGCPVCSGIQVLKGYNDLLTTNPKLVTEWNYEKNSDLKPDSVTSGCGKKVWWKCEKGHEWQAAINNRNKGTGCPYCSGNKVLKGYNDLQTINPILAKEWNYEQNGKLKPDMVTANNGKTVWWKCDKGHKWQANISDRNKGNGCPYCAGKKVLKGYNDLQTINLALAKEWHYGKNGDLKPSMVTSGSHKKVWWKCDKGHEWQAAIYSRNKGTGCPYCSGRYTIKGN